MKPITGTIAVALAAFVGVFAGWFVNKAMSNAIATVGTCACSIEGP